MAPPQSVDHAEGLLKPGWKAGIRMLSILACPRLHPRRLAPDPCMCNCWARRRAAERALWRDVSPRVSTPERCGATCDGSATPSAAKHDWRRGQRAITLRKWRRCCEPSMGRSSDPAPTAGLAPSLGRRPLGACCCGMRQLEAAAWLRCLAAGAVRLRLLGPAPKLFSADHHTARGRGCGHAGATNA